MKTKTRNGKNRRSVAGRQSGQSNTGKEPWMKKMAILKQDLDALEADASVQALAAADTNKKPKKAHPTNAQPPQNCKNRLEKTVGKKPALDKVVKLQEEYDALCGMLESLDVKDKKKPKEQKALAKTIQTRYDGLKKKVHNVGNHLLLQKRQKQSKFL